MPEQEKLAVVEDAAMKLDLQSYPNPFNPTAVISFAIPIAADVSIAVYDMIGREVEVLLREFRRAGNHEVTFHSGNLPSGIYFCRLQAGSYVLVKKLVLIR